MSLSPSSAPLQLEDGGQPVDKSPPRSWQQGFAGLLAVVAILALSTLAGAAVADLFDRVSDAAGPRAFRPGVLENLTTLRLAVFLATFQVTALVLSFLAASRFDADRRRLMALAGPGGGVRASVVSVAMLLAMAAVYGASIYVFDRKPLLGDVQLLADMMRADVWWTIALVAIIGAPVAEEVVFRGLLYGVLRETPAGKVAAAIITAFVWAMVHAQYSAYGLTAIFLIGLYLAFVRERTDSLLPPIVCHATYNGAIVAALALLPPHLLQPG